MVNSALVETIKVLRPEEISRLRLYFESSFFKREPHSNDIAKLFGLIADTYPDFAEAAVDRDKAYAALFAEKVPVKGKLEKVMSELSQQIRSFLLSSDYLREENQFEQGLHWATWLRNRGLADRYELAISKLEKWQQSESSFEPEFFYRQFLIEREKHNTLAPSNQKKGDVNLPNVIQNLDFFYHLSRLEYLNRLQLQKKVTILDIPVEIDPEFVEHPVPNRYLENNPELYAEYHLFKLLKYSIPPEDEVLSFTHWLSEHEQEIGREPRNRLWAYVRGLYSILINSGRKEIILMIHQIHQDNLEKGYMFFQGKLSPSAYKNVTYAALAAGQPKWALEFVEKYKDLIIGENETRDFYRLNQAFCFFALGEYDKALDILPQASTYSDYHSAARRLELKIYFELNSDLLPYKMESFKMYVYRASKNTLAEGKKELLLNFYNLLFQICQSPKGDKARAQQIVRRIEKKNSVAEKSWLIEKAQQLG
ncbi:MAG: hypothetical protein H7246_12730 [Phycisphaerae bacterium]|nr:hypothetical protein [Saprospiraceae bacterium]